MPPLAEVRSISSFSYEETKMTKALSGREFKRTLSNTPKTKRNNARADR